MMSMLRACSARPNCVMPSPPREREQLPRRCGRQSSAIQILQHLEIACPHFLEGIHGTDLAAGDQVFCSLKHAAWRVLATQPCHGAAASLFGSPWALFEAL